MGLANWFTTFCNNIQVRNKDTISTSYKNITKRLNKDFWDTTSDTSHSLYVGSYGRNTATKGFSDLDMIFELPHSVYDKYDAYSRNGQSALLQEVKNSIVQRYPQTDIGADGQVIEVQFASAPKFEVVPSFRQNDDSYVYPDTTSGGQWRTTDPRPEIDAIRSRNRKYNRNLIRLCRMMRAWKSEWNVPIGGLLIDTLAYQFIDNWKYNDKSFIFYDWMCRDFFDFMALQSKSQEYWRAPGSNQYVYSQGNFQAKARRCHNLAVEAISRESQDSSAKRKWREIFGTDFPS